MGQLDWIWRQWWAMTAIWWTATMVLLVALKHQKNKLMLTAWSNLFATVLLFVVLLVKRENLLPRAGWRRAVVAIAILAGTERTLTNAALLCISTTLKTALHAFNIIITFFFAAFGGADPQSKECLLNCRCQGNFTLAASLAFLTGGGLLAALRGGKLHDPKLGSEPLGVLVQLSSGIAYALKFTVVKRVYHSSPEENQVNPPPSKMQTALIASPFTALASIIGALISGATFEVSPPGPTIVTGASIVVILVAELQLTELTSPLVIAVLSAVHNVLIVLFFTLTQGEKIGPGVAVGFGCSTVGIMIFAWNKHKKAQLQQARQVNFATPADQEVSMKDMPHQPQMMTVQCPWDATPQTSEIQVQTADGRTLMVVLPPGVEPGGMFQVTV